MKHNYLMIATMAIIALFLVSSVVTLRTSAYTAAKTDNQKNVSFSIENGGIANAGPQNWRMRGGNLVSVLITSLPAVTSWSDLKYSMNATLNGLTSSGTFKLHMQGLTSSGKTVNLRIDAAVVSSIPAVCFPSYSITVLCSNGDTSEIPAFFVVAGYMITGSSSTDSAAKIPVSLLVEVAALNPFGAPIVISSATDNSIAIVATYNHARTFWYGVQVEGALVGSMGKTATPVTGNFVENIVTTENYVTGTARDNGTIALIGMSVKDLNAQGTFQGTSTIPTTGEMACPPLGLPPGTCIETGFLSKGSFTLTNQKDWTIKGKYDVLWPAPSITFGGSITAKIDTGSNSGD
jgi:hypothetical protein